MIKIGLTFSGGGGKGGYEIGVWKALKEFGIIKNITAVSGTSVGALNGALFLGGDYEKGENVWKTISTDSILKIEPDKIASGLASLSLPGGPLIKKLLKGYAATGVFSQSGLKNIIEKNINSDLIINSNIPFHVCAYNYRNLTTEYIKLNGESHENIVQYLLASAAMPIIWDPVVVKGTSYYDGGLGDNIPVTPVVNEGCDTIITVILDQAGEFGKQQLKYNNTHFWKIVPKENLGGLLTGTLDFDPHKAKIRIDQGYNDTKQLLQNYYEFILIEGKYVKNVHEIRAQDHRFVLAANENKLLRASLDQSKQGMLEGQTSLQYLLNTSEPLKQLSHSNFPAHNPIDLVKHERELEASLKQSEKKIINDSLEITFKEMVKSSGDRTKYAFMALTAIDPVEGRTKELQNQGFFKRLWNGVTGKNQRLIAESQHDIYKAVYATNQFMKKLAEQNQLTMEVLVSYGNKLEYLQQQIQHQYIHMTALFEGVKYLHASIGHLAQKFEVSISEINDRIDRLEQRDKILMWHTSLNGFSHDGTLYGDLDPIKKVGLVVSELFKHTGGDIDYYFYPFLKSALMNLGIKNQDVLAPYDFFYSLTEQSAFSDDFFSNVGIESSLVDMNKQTLEYYPFLNGVKIAAKGNGNPNSTSPSMLSEVAILAPFATINILNFAVELLISLSEAKRFKQRDSRELFLESLNQCLKIDSNERSTGRFKERIITLQNKLESYKFLVPVLGPMNSGKSSLLNAYLGTDTLLVGLDKKSNYPIELHYGTEEKVVLILENGETVTEDVECLKFSEKNSRNVIRAEVYLNNRTLKMNDNVILVDMPNMDNNYSSSLLNYAREGSYYIITLDNATQLEATFRKALGEVTKHKRPCSVFLTRGSIVTSSDRDKIVSDLTRKLPMADYFYFVESKGSSINVQGMEKVLDEIKAQRQKIIYKQFISEVNNIIQRMINRYQFELSEENFALPIAEEKVMKSKKLLAKCEKQIETATDDLDTSRSEKTILPQSDSKKVAPTDNDSSLQGLTKKRNDLSTKIDEQEKVVIEENRNYELRQEHLKSCLVELDNIFNITAI